MADPGYDFFATGAPGAAEPTAPPAPPTVNRFGTPIPPEDAVAPPAAPVVSAPAAAPAPAPVPGYHPGHVNQFGTSAELAAVPTGPYAAPGLGAAPIEQPGLVSTWAGPAAAPTSAPAAPAPVAPAPVAVSRFGSPIPPDVLVEDPSYAALAFGTQAAATTAYGAPAHGAHGAAHGQGPRATAGPRPGRVLAAGIIGIVEGGLLLVAGLLALLGYLALKAQFDAIAASGELAGTGLTVSSVTNLILVLVFLFLLIGTGYVVAGIAAVRGARWGAWALLVVSVLNILFSIYATLTGDADLGTVLAVCVSGTVVALLCQRDSMQWLRRS